MLLYHQFCNFHVVKVFRSKAGTLKVRLEIKPPVLSIPNTVLLELDKYF